MRRSPAVRTGVTPLPLFVGDWFSSKSMLVVPEGACTRSQARYKKSVPEIFWLAGEKRVRLLLLFGMDPETTLGTAVSSLVPLPKELSVFPVGWSRSHPCLGFEAQLMPILAQSLFPPVFTARFPSSSKRLLPGGRLGGRRKVVGMVACTVTEKL